MGAWISKTVMRITDIAWLDPLRKERAQIKKGRKEAKKEESHRSRQGWKQERSEERTKGRQEELYNTMLLTP